jgi:hypothetical protein
MSVTCEHWPVSVLARVHEQAAFFTLPGTLGRLLAFDLQEMWAIEGVDHGNVLREPLFLPCKRVS